MVRPSHVRPPALCLALALLAAPAVAAPAAEAARAAGERVGERLEALRDPARRDPRLDVAVRIEETAADRSLDALRAGAPEPPASAFDAARFEPRPAPPHETRLRTDAVALDRTGAWSRGEARLAREGSGFLDLEGSVATLSAGLDVARGARTARGLSASLDRRRFGDDAVGTQAGLLGYGSFQPLPSSFLDLVGGTVLDGRGGAEPLLFGSATLAVERRRAGWLLAPYGRAAALGGEGPGGLRGRLVAGLRTERVIELRGRRLRPQLRLEAERARLPGEARAHRSYTLTPAPLADIAPDWDARIEHRSTLRETGRESRLEVRLTGRF